MSQLKLNLNQDLIKASEGRVVKAYREDFTNRGPRDMPPKKWTNPVQEDTGLLIVTAVDRC